MTVLKRPTVGPILGYTSGETARIFGRGDVEDRETAGQRWGHLALRYRKKGEEYLGPLFFKLNPVFDMTGVALLTGLCPATDYEYQMGWFFSDTATEDFDASKDLDWNAVPWISFRTASDSPNEDRSIIAGSCRYALPLGDATLFDRRGDKTFRSVLRQIEESKSRVDILLMCGDQIYADPFGVGGVSLVQKFYERYRMAFSTKHLAKLMSSVPTYMMLDDHEIENDWPAHASCGNRLEKLPHAVHAYMAYQGNHSPLLGASQRRLEGTPGHLWYQFVDGCCSFFVCDTRTERTLPAEDPELVGRRQLDTLLRWLREEWGGVKVLVTSVPFYEHLGGDKWNGFVDQRDEIIKTVHDSKVQRLVVISGDVHASMASELLVRGEGTSRIVSVVSSAFFWPYPHWGRRSFYLEGAIKTKLKDLHAVAQNGTEVYARNVFTRLDVSPASVRVRFYSRKGKELGSKCFEF